MESLISLLPVLPRIMAAEISVDATMPYWGEVEVCIMKASLKVSSSTSPLMWIIEAWEKAASSLWVDWVS
ncbi:hypothetical protein D3C77_732540 [compost metagenome]